MANQRFNGDRKVGQSILTGAETAFKLWAVPRLPQRLETYHLTLMTLLWSAGNVGFGYVARVTDNLNWLWPINLMIVLQYVTDLFDGEVGRQRHTGLVKWGFFMDHFLDYVFLASLVIGGALVAPAGLLWWMLVLMALLGCFMVNSFLSFAATNKFEIYHLGFGPTEMRVGFVVINTLVIFTGTAHFAWTVPITCGLLLIALAVLVFMTQRRLWKMDLEAKRKTTPAVADIDRTTTEAPARRRLPGGAAAERRTGLPAATR